MSSILSKTLILLGGIGGIASMLACSPKQQEVKFDKEDWVKYNDGEGTYPYRDRMLNDLVKHHQLNGLTYKQLVDSIGEPSNYGEQDDNVVQYLIFEGFESDIDPVHGKTLDLTLGPDSVVTAYKVTEW